MAIDKEKLKKHHFWILSGIIPFLALTATLLIITKVGGTIVARQKDITDAEGNLEKSKNPKTDGLLDLMEKQKVQLAAKREQLWRFNWDEQQKVFTWPQGDPRPGFEALRSQVLKNYEQMNMPFLMTLGETQRQEIYEEFKKENVYLKAYEGMALSVAPTQFGTSPQTGMPQTSGGDMTTQAGTGWKAALRHVNDWGTKTTESWQIWLALEDYWIQRVLLEGIKAINDKMSRFQRVPLTDPQTKAVVDEPLRRKFKSRVWEAELWVEDRGAKGRVLRGKLTNVSDRLQLLGVGNRMVLRVKLDKGLPDDQATLFRIEGEFVPAGVTIDVKEITAPDGNHTLTAGQVVTEIADVQQIFDTRTVPVRRIDRIALNYMSSRHQKGLPDGLKMHKKVEEAEAANPVPPTGMPGGEGPGIPGGLRSGEFGMGPFGGFGGSGGGPVQAVINVNKKRYVVATPQVRRMPVAVDLVVDQAYIQDVLLAFANTPIRFQTAQTEYRRFRGTLGTGNPNDPGGSSGIPDGPVAQARAFQGDTFQMPGGDGFAGVRRFDTGTEGGPAGGVSPASVVSESQITAGLVELAVYGVVSLYEKYADQANPMP